MPRTSPSGTPMTSWTKWRIQSLRNHRVTSLGKEGAAHSCLTQFPHNDLQHSWVELPVGYQVSTAAAVTMWFLCCRWSLPPEGLRVQGSLQCGAAEHGGGYLPKH